MNKWIPITFLSLSAAFVLFSWTLYSDENSYEKKPPDYDPEMQKQGRLVWQKYNCHVCHQLYGLGGFLGPDLTNVSEKGFFYIDAFLKNGAASMPAFELTAVETKQLVEFLKATNASGSSNPKDYKKLWNGMIEQ
ncbi:cytochrome c [uncultured Planktosalinus sp.]|uniref:c-type cytochrome n=1 Tax=uncultured Planktosalinus sp. TaxID=1810935 RepID=UPI0030DAA377